MAVVCEICGGSIVKNGDSFSCSNCGISYSAEELRKLAAANISTGLPPMQNGAAFQQGQQYNNAPHAPAFQPNAAAMPGAYPENNPPANINTGVPPMQNSADFHQEQRYNNVAQHAPAFQKNAAVMPGAYQGNNSPANINTGVPPMSNVAAFQQMQQYDNTPPAPMFQQNAAGMPGAYQENNRSTTINTQVPPMQNDAAFQQTKQYDNTPPAPVNTQESSEETVNYPETLGIEPGICYKFASAKGECLSITTQIFYALTFLEDHIAVDTNPKRKNKVPEIKYTDIAAVGLKTSINLISVIWAILSAVLICLSSLWWFIFLAIDLVYIFTNKKLSIILKDGRTAVFYHNIFADQLWKSQVYNNLVEYLTKIADINNKRISI